MIRPWPHAGLLWLAAMAATLASCNGRLAAPGDAETAIRPKVRAWTGSGRGPMSDPEPDRTHIAGLTVSIWKPSTGGRGHLPLLIFSHGFHGRGAQSKFLMRAIADDGYLVMAPDHKDAGLGRSARPETPFGNPATWTDSTYRDRADDVRGLLKGLRDDPNWSRAIDWSKVALAGHSLGGYTVLGLAGAWPAWRVSGIKAVLALSPYSMPFQIKGGLSGLDVPVMYQGGTRDAGVTPWIADKRGAFAPDLVSRLLRGIQGSRALRLDRYQSEVSGKHRPLQPRIPRSVRQGRQVARPPTEVGRRSGIESEMRLRVKLEAWSLADNH